MVVEKEIRNLETGHTVVILRVEGLIKLGESAEFFVSALSSLLRQEPIVDLAKVDYIDSTGIGEFIGSCIAVARAGHKLVLMNVSDRIIKLLEIAHATEDLKLLTMHEAAAYRSSEEAPHIYHQVHSAPHAATRVVTVRDARSEHGSTAPTKQAADIIHQFDSAPHAITRVVTARDARAERGSTVPTKQMRVVTFHGDIQQIEFRFFPWRLARKVGLNGWIQNKPNGTVVACVEGDETAIQEWLSDVRDGPFGYQVKRIEQELMDFTGAFHTFDVRL